MCEAAEKDLYAVLGASPSESVQQLRHRYQQLALQYHPDRLGGECSSEAESGVKKFLEVDAAWRILSDQNTRRQYDLQRRVRELKQDWPVDSTICLEDMTWEQGSILSPASKLLTGFPGGPLLRSPAFPNLLPARCLRSVHRLPAITSTLLVPHCTS
ncbi:dnaJ homolog subfamily C member 24 isoform X2 [Siniperca chuatsi]|uniref:dnaJ homolog subfamily C member 24 isoform X2 n=1 Tax=Siniperca chuatsi TaxID=119488 RepID=UPI001CE1E42B|nr:dnaJ homolog subfamily C member 24 isoform X2 [Siniperca chuatsi]XP_044049159.1 dnaJ homolog subfamily C member 24 isoform X2 [Siniperca chuatsi]